MLFVVYTLLIYAVVIGVAMGVDDIEIVYNAIGAICSTSIVVVLPCLFYVRLIKKNNKAKGLRYYSSWILMIVMTPYSIFSIIALYTSGGGDENYQYF